MRLALGTLFVALLLSCSSGASVQSPASSLDVVADQVAIEAVIDDALGHAKLSVTQPYCVPVPADIPLEFLLARAVYTDGELFRLRVNELQYYVNTSTNLMSGAEYADAVVRGALANAQASRKTAAADPSNVTERFEISRNDLLSPTVVAEILKVAATLKVAAYKNLVKDRIRVALAKQPTLAAELAVRPISPALVASRAKVKQLVAQAERKP